MRQVLGPGALGRPRGIGWRGRREGGSGWGTHVNPWLIHVNVWQKPLQCCKVISFQLIKINGKKNTHTNPHTHPHTHTHTLLIALMLMIMMIHLGKDRPQFYYFLKRVLEISLNSLNTEIRKYKLLVENDLLIGSEQYSILSSNSLRLSQKLVPEILENRETGSPGFGQVSDPFSPY